MSEKRRKNAFTYISFLIFPFWLNTKVILDLSEPGDRRDERPTSSGEMAILQERDRGSGTFKRSNSRNGTFSSVSQECTLLHV